MNRLLSILKLIGAFPRTLHSPEIWSGLPQVSRWSCLAKAAKIWSKVPAWPWHEVQWVSFCSTYAGALLWRNSSLQACWLVGQVKKSGYIWKPEWVDIIGLYVDCITLILHSSKRLALLSSRRIFNTISQTAPALAMVFLKIVSLLTKYWIRFSFSVHSTFELGDNGVLRMQSHYCGRPVGLCQIPLQITFDLPTSLVCQKFHPVV